jgi:ferredoxin-type protein NapH
MVSMIKNSINNFFSKLLPYRLWVQLSFLFVWLDPFSLRLHTICGPVFHCHSCPLATFACPIGVIANFSALHLLPFIAVGIVVTAGIFLGSLICGWVCPFGLLQDLLARIPTPKYGLPKWTSISRYVVLAGAVLAVPFFLGKDNAFFICRFCPVGGLESAAPNIIGQAASGGQILLPNPLKLTIILLLLTAVFFVKRPWCRTLCPLGAIFGLFNRFSIFYLHFSPGRCTDCKECRKLCDYGIEPDKNPSDTRCIRCLECTRCNFNCLTLDSIFQKDKKLEK